METPLPQVLLQHGAFVRALALRLVRDPHLAEDAAQETWLRYLERPPGTDGNLRGWLRRVLTNWSMNLRRGRAGDPALLHDPASEVEDEVARGELLRRVVEAVLALEEPYRTTILERYFRARSARAIASAGGVPLATVRSREQRALEKLRTALDRECGERSSWAFALASLVNREGMDSATVSVTSWVLTGSVLILAVVGTVALWRAVARTQVERGSGMPSRLRGEPMGGSELLATRATREQEAFAAPGADKDLRRETGVIGLSREGAQQTCEIRGRFLLPGGAPAGGVRLFLSGCSGYADDLRPMEEGDGEWDSGEDWEGCEGITDSDGRFALVFDPPSSSVVLDADGDAFVREEWEWDGILPGGLEDIGEVVLRPAGKLEGRLLDRHGLPMRVEGWCVYVRGTSASARPGAEPLASDTRVDPDTGEFRLEGLPAGPLHLRATGSGVEIRDTVTIVPGQTTLADIVDDGPDLRQRITLVASVPIPFHVDGLLAHMSGNGIEPRMVECDDLDDSFVFEELPPGSYTLEIDDPRVLPWSQTEVRPGSTVWADLVGSSGLHLDVRDRDGNPVRLYTVDLERRKLGRTVVVLPNHRRMHSGREPLPGGRLGGLFAGEYTIAVGVQGCGTQRAQVALPPGTVLSLSFVFDESLRLSGHICHPDGAPASGSSVLLLAPAARADSPTSPIWDRHPFAEVAPERDEVRREIARTTCDAQGAFRFLLPEAGTYAVGAFPGEDRSLLVATGSLRIEAEEPPDEVELVFPSTGAIRGRVLRPPDSPWKVRLCADTGSTIELVNSSSARTVGLSSDGSFEFDGLLPGARRIYLVLPGARAPMLANGSSGGVAFLGTVEVLEHQTVQAELDATAIWPGSVAVQVLVDGEPGAGIRIGLKDVSRESDLEGRAVLPAFPGTGRLWLQAFDPEWSHVVPTPVLVASNRETSRCVSIELARGVLECVDSSGEPLARQVISIWFAADLALEFPETDDSGRLRLTLPPGEYELGLGLDGVRRPLTWEATGPAVRVIRF